MKPRVVKTTKILAVAITAGIATTACTTPEQPRPETQPTASRVEAPPPQVTAAPSAAAQHAAPPSDDKADSKLLALREKLYAAGKQKALADEATYRPLCDADGYPLVGNLARKSPEGPFLASDFCAEVRAKKKS